MVVVFVISVMSPVAVIAIGVVFVMMVSITVIAVMSPVVVFTVSVVIAPVPAIVSLIAITMVVVVAFMVSILIHRYDDGSVGCRFSDLDADVNLGHCFRRRSVCVRVSPFFPKVFEDDVLGS
jgi:hypothetical protein